MSRNPISIRVKSIDLLQIGELLRGGIQQVGVVLRALSIRQLATGFTAPQVAQALPLTAKAIRQIAHRYIKDGLDAAIYDKQRPGTQEILDAAQKQRIVAMVFSDPPRILLLAFLVYAASGPIQYLLQLRRDKTLP